VIVLKKQQNGHKIVLTASATEMSGFRRNPFFAFVGSFPKGMLPLSFCRRFYPPVLKKEVAPSEKGITHYAPYGLRKVEASLIDNGGFDESDVVCVHPYYLKHFIGPKTKVVGITAMDSLGLAYVSLTYSNLLRTFGNVSSIPINTIEFQKLCHNKALSKFRPKVIVGGAGAWQVKGKKTRRFLGIDSVMIGEGDKEVPKLFRDAVEGKKISPVVYTSSPNEDEIPPIKHASIYGNVEISRGCGRHCQFCTPTMQKRRDVPMSKIIKEVEVNVNEGADMITTATEDALLYKCNDKKFIPNEDAVIGLFKKLASYDQILSIQPAHISLAPVVAAPKLIEELSNILIEKSYYKHNGKPKIAVETGIESGSSRLMAKYMKGKSLPYKPEEWREVVAQAYGILNDNDWVPLSTLIVGFPGETEDDTIKTLELIDDLRGYTSFFVPLLFVPLDKCILQNERGADLNSLTELQWEFLSRCWGYNVQIWKDTWFSFESFYRKAMQSSFAKFIVPFIGAAAYLTWFRGRPGAQYYKKFIFEASRI
jgi:radical SAM superfamily enzyme YgiQ (UPF0313 family)